MPKFLDDIIVDGGAKLGVGTTSPTSKLHVVGNVAIQSDDDNRFLVRSNDYTISRIISRGNSGTNLDKGLFSLMSSDGTNNNVEKVRIDTAGNSWFNGGNIGIGTTSPSQALEVYSTIKIGETGVTGGRLISGDSMIFQIDSDNSSGSSSYRFRCNGAADDGTELMRIQENGNVGIGHATLYQKFTVNGNIDIRGGDGCLLTFNNGDGGIGVHFNNTGTVGRDIAIKTYEAGVGNTEKMRVTKKGDVGIGTASPSSKLEVVGTITSSVVAGTGRIRSGASGQLHLGDDSDIVSFGRTNEMWSMPGVDTDQTLYLHYRGYNNSNTRFRSFDVRDGKAGSIALFRGSDKKTIFGGHGQFDTNLKINAPDGGGAPAMTAVLDMHGYEGRGVGIKMRDNVNSASSPSNREWFVGTGYNQSGFNIGYASDGSQSSYSAQAKLSIGTNGNAVFAGNVTLDPSANSDVSIHMHANSGALGDAYAWNLIAENSADNYEFTIAQGTTDVLKFNNTAAAGNNNATFAGTGEFTGGGNTLLLKKGTGTAALTFGGTSGEASFLIEGVAGGGGKFYTSTSAAGTIADPGWSPKLTIEQDGDALFAKDIVLNQGSRYFRNASDSTQRHGFVADHVYEFNQLDLQINAGRKLYLDGGSNTYIHQSSSDVVDVVTGGSTRLTVNSNGISSSSNIYSGSTGHFRNYPGTWKASTGTTGNGFIFENSIDGTALTLSSTGVGTFAGDIRNTLSYQTGTVSTDNPALKAVLLAHSTESNSAAIHPYLFNDLANFRKRGGTINYGGLSSNPSDAASDIMFQASALTCSISNSVITGSTWTIELKDFPRALYYGTRFGISFGSVSFAPTSMLIQYSTDNGANYTTALTSSVRNEYYHTYISNGGTAINAVKFTIGKFSTHSPRLMNIYAYNYDSRGMTEYFLDKAGGALYGNLSMHSSGFTLDGNTITGIDNASEFTDDDNHIMTSAAIKNKIADNDNNFITASSLPTDFVSAANGGTFASNVAFTGNITANGNVNGDGDTNVGNMNKVTTKQLVANGASLKIGDQQGASITMGKVESEISGVGQNDATDVVIASNLTVTKKLLIRGELETETTTNTIIKDNVIQLNDGGNSANTKDSGIVIHRGTSQNVAIVWDEDGQTAGGAFRFIATGDTASSADVSMTPQNENGENVIGGASALGFQDVFAAHFRAVGAGNTSGFVGDGSGVTNLNMGNASSGTLAVARGGTGITNFSDANYKNSNVTSVTGSSGSCTGNAATATALSTSSGLTTVPMTFQLAANTWTDTGIDGSDLVTGTYVMQVYVEDFSAGGGHYYEHYSATISWYGGSTNSTSHDEIVLHRAGHAPNNSHIQIRTLRASVSDSHDLMLQVKQNFAHTAALNSTSGKTMIFKFRRLI